MIKFEGETISWAIDTVIEIALAAHAEYTDFLSKQPPMYDNKPAFEMGYHLEQMIKSTLDTCAHKLMLSDRFELERILHAYNTAEKPDAEQKIEDFLNWQNHEPIIFDFFPRKTYEWEELERFDGKKMKVLKSVTLYTCEEYHKIEEAQQQ